MSRANTGLVVCAVMLLPLAGWSREFESPVMPSKAVAIGKNAAGSANLKAKLPPGAYVRKPVKSTTELLGHAKSDPSVMNRYVRTYRMNEKSVVAALTDLRLTTLSKDLNANIYFVTEKGKVVYKYRKVKKGTRVFVSSTGRPALLQSCGNPISAVLPTFNPLPPVPRMALNPDLAEPPYIGDMEGYAGNPNQTTLPDGADAFATETGFGPMVAFPFAVGGPAGSFGPGQMDNFVDHTNSGPENPGFINLPPISGGGGGGFTPLVSVPEPGTVAFAGSVGVLLCWIGLRRRRQNRH